MKKINYLIALIFVLLTIGKMQAQEISASLDAAQSAYSSNNYLLARENLQKAIIDINNLMGKEILALMPSSLGGLGYDPAQDNIIANTGFAGLLVTRVYGTDNNKKIEVTLANDSPLLAMVNAFLGNSMLSGIMASQTGQKQVTISGYKGMLESSDLEEGTNVYTINVPLGDSLFTFESTGFSSESEAVSMATLINIDKIAEMLK